MARDLLSGVEFRVQPNLKPEATKLCTATLDTWLVRIPPSGLSMGDDFDLGFRVPSR